MFSLNMVDYSMSFLLLSTWVFCWTSRGDHSEPFLLFDFWYGTLPSCLKVMGDGVGWGGVAHEILVSAQGPLVLCFGVSGLRVWGQGLTTIDIILKLNKTKWWKCILKFISSNKNIYRYKFRKKHCFVWIFNFPNSVGRNRYFVLKTSKAKLLFEIFCNHKENELTKVYQSKWIESTIDQILDHWWFELYFWTLSLFISVWLFTYSMNVRFPSSKGNTLKEAIALLPHTLGSRSIH